MQSVIQNITTYGDNLARLSKNDKALGFYLCYNYGKVS